MKVFLVVILFILVLFLLLFFIFYPAFNIPKFFVYEKAVESVKHNIQKQQYPFEEGETFNFYYTMGPLRAGSAQLRLVGERNLNNTKTLLVTFESQVGVFYDIETIYIDYNTLYPVYIQREIKNLGLTTEITEEYDQSRLEVDITKKGILGTQTKNIKKNHFIHNPLSLIYFCRKLPMERLEPGFEFDIVLPLEEFKLVLKSIEEIEIPSGTYQSYFFESHPKRIKLWLSTDEKRIPLKMENLTSLGPSSIVLDK